MYMVVAAAGALFAVCAYLLAIGKAATHRRIAASLGLIAVVGLSAPLVLSGGWSTPRTVVLVSNRALPTNRIAPLLASLPSRSEVATLMISDGTVPVRNTFAGFAAPQRVCEISATECVSSVVLAPSASTWVAESIQSALNMLRSGDSPGHGWTFRSIAYRVWGALTLRKRTIILWFSRSGAFGSVALSQDSRQLIDALVDDDVDLHFVEDRDVAPAHLEITLQRGAVPESVLFDLSDRFWIDLPLTLRREFSEGLLQLWAEIDGPIVPERPRELKSSAFPLEVPLAGPTNQTLTEGYHRLRVRLASSRSDGRLLVAEGSTYFRVEKHKVLAVSRRPLEWKQQVVGGVDGLAASQAARVASLWYRLDPESLTSISFEQAQTLTREQFASYRSVWIVAPTPDQWTLLWKTVGLESSVRNGVNVFVVEPPPTATDLPMTSYTIRDQPMRVHYDRRLYFVADMSRISELPPISQITTRLDAQQQIVGTILRRLGVSGTPASFQQPWPAVVCDGRAALDTRSCSDSSLRVYAPLSVVNSRQDVVRYGYASEVLNDWQAALRGELAPASVNIRLSQLIRDDGGDSFLKSTDMYPNTVVVVLATDVPQIDLRDKDLPQSLQTRVHRFNWRSEPVAVSRSYVPSDLLARGVSVALVSLPLDKEYQDYYRTAGSRFGRLAAALTDAPQGEAVPATEVRQGTLVHLDSGQMPVDELISRIVGLVQSISVSQNVSTRFTSRVIDERLPRYPSQAPQSHLLMHGPSAAPFDYPLASVVDSAPTPRVSSLPLVSAANVGEGYVVVLAYNPFEAPTWSRADSGLKPGGWGIQRLVDAMDRSASFRPSTDAAQLAEVEELQDGSTLLLHCWTKFDSGGSIPTATLAGQELEVVALEPTSNRVTFQLLLRDERQIRGHFHLAFPKVAVPPIPVFVDLKGTRSPGRTTSEILAKIADLSGGGTLDLTLGYAVDELEFARSGTWVLGILIALLLGVHFSPAIIAWNGLSYWYALVRRRSQAAAVLETSQLAPFDAESALTEWGLNPGSATAIRAAGTPGATKIYEVGDSVSLARRSTLIPYTEFGRSLRLPLQRPVLRQRHSTRSLRAYVYVDASRSLRIPEYSESVTKTAFASSLAFFLCQTVLRRAGTVVLSSFPEGSPSMAVVSSTPLSDVQAWVSGLPVPQANASLSLPLDTQPGDLVFVVSDLLALYWDALPEFSMSLAEEAIDFRLVHIEDEFEYLATGLVWDGSSRTVLDRSGWDRDDVARAIREYVSRQRGVIEQAGGRCVSTRTDVPSEQILDVLTDDFLK